MLNKFSQMVMLILLSAFVMTTAGCTVIFQKGRRTDVTKIQKLKEELTDLERAKAELENRLKREIADKEVSVEMLEKGLVITFVAEVLFDSGKADLRKESFEKIDKIAQILNTTVKDLNVGVEGHTDNDPIKHSGWKSNWHLSSGRALSVLEYLQKMGIDADRLSATGFGEHRPVAPNATKEEKQKNRRVEIVILPPVTKTGR